MTTTMTPLEMLQWNWSEMYAITGAADRWLAQRRDGEHRTLTATSPDELRQLMIEDYAEQPVVVS